MTTHRGHQYTLSSPHVVPITPIGPPKWSHKEIFSPLELTNIQGGLHDLPKYVDSWIPKFTREVGAYGNTHWSKLCESYEFHQSRK